MGIEDRKKREKKMLEQMRINQIQQAAQEVFMQKGFGSATIEDISKRAELSPATIYLYFKNKYELYASLNLKTLKYFQTQIDTVYSNTKLSVEAKILGFKEVMYSMSETHPTFLRLVFLSQLQEDLEYPDKEIFNKINNVSKKTMSMIASVYEEGVLQGLFEEGHSIALADIMWAMFSGLFLWEGTKTQINPEKDFFKPTLDKAFDIFLKGIRKYPEREKD